MKKETEIRRGRHVVFNLHVHLVFVTKYRREVFTQAILNDLHSILQRFVLILKPH
ncbi:Transposase and inactivated derivatives [Mannheimia haemolytica]|uniref:Transposase and inactivated derivatives n=1 Tax=Mannheimia haemolytica TaxID=75985 RepID=A0A378N064_MANHA|nr:Transposase and inactivated derivatives [Mannheimia haemolytica]